MTKKHFNALAQALKTNRPLENWCPNKKAQWDLDVKAIADVCRSHNFAFDRDRFLSACGGLFNT